MWRQKVAFKYLVSSYLDKFLKNELFKLNSFDDKMAIRNYGIGMKIICGYNKYEAQSIDINDTAYPINQLPILIKK